MEFNNRVLLILSISFLILSLSVKGFDLSPSPSPGPSPSSFSSASASASPSLSPSPFSSLSPSPTPAIEPNSPSPSPNSELEDGLDEVFEEKLTPGPGPAPAPGPSSFLDEAQEELALAPSPTLNKVHDALSPISSLDLDAMSPGVDEAKQALGPISSFDDAKEALGPVSPDLVDEAQQALGPVSSSSIQDAKEALGPVSPNLVDEAKQVLGPVSSIDDAWNKAQEQLGPISSYMFLETGTEADAAPVSAPSSFEFAPAPAPVSNGKAPSPGPVSVSPSEAPSPAPSSTKELGSIASMMSVATKTGFANLVSSSPSPSPSPSPSGRFDDDAAMAIETRINQGMADTKLAIDEAKNLLNDPTIASSKTGLCLRECIDKYAASIDELNKAIMDLWARDGASLTHDFDSVEEQISACQECFSENIGEDSPLKDLEEATTKAARESLTVLDYFN